MGKWLDADAITDRMLIEAASELAIRAIEKKRDAALEALARSEEGRTMTSTTTEITYSYIIENNTGREKTGVCTSLSAEGAVAVAVDVLGARKLRSGGYIYFARETQQHYVVTAEEMMAFGAAHHCRSGSDHYSLWAASSGREATDAEIEEICEA